MQHQSWDHRESHPGPGPSVGPDRAHVKNKRAKAACTPCNQRKIKCDVTVTGPPCSNCKADNNHANCEIVQRKKYKARQTRLASASSDPSNNDPSFPYGRHAHASSSSYDHPREIAWNVPTRPGEDEFSYEGPSDTRIDQLAGMEASGELPDDRGLSYLGDARGPRRFLNDVVYPHSPEKPRTSISINHHQSRWTPREFKFLQSEGVFSLMERAVSEGLLRCYLHNVHFFLPILDLSTFWKQYEEVHQSDFSSVMLYWSVMLAATNFADDTIIAATGFASRKAMKAATYARAKLAYDLDKGIDKIALLQSVILMSFWYTDPQDHTGAWYWIGIAISQAQALGLHRRDVGPTRPALARRLWWSCIIRDRWVSLAKGRPMRIHDEDFDQQLPTAADILSDLPTDLLIDQLLPSVPEVDQLSQLWVSLVHVSDILGRILRVHYLIREPDDPTSPQNAYLRLTKEESLAIHAAELERCRAQFSLSQGSNMTVRVQYYHLELFTEATAIVLFRAFVLKAVQENDDAASRALESARAAAARTNAALERLIELQALTVLKPMFITAIIPAMQIHLFDCKSSDSLRYGFAHNKLELCMLVLEQLRNTYWSAGVVWRLFRRALDLVGRGPPTSAHPYKAILNQKNQQTPESMAGSNTSVTEDTQGFNPVPSSDWNQLPGNSNTIALDPALWNTGGEHSSAAMGQSSSSDGAMWTMEEINNLLLAPNFAVPDNAFDAWFPSTDINSGVGSQPYTLLEK